MIYIAHKTNDEIQTVKQHSENTAKLAKSFAINSLKNTIYDIGLLHDIGKYQHSFQKRINGENIRIAHSVCGAKEIDNIDSISNYTKIMCKYCISGHHSGLQNYGSNNDDEYSQTLCATLNKSTEDYRYYKEELCYLDSNELDCILKNEYEKNRDNLKFSENFAFLTRYAFSCLTDADSLDTQKFCNKYDQKTLKSNFPNCLDKINSKLDSFVCKTKLQETRKILQEQVYSKVDINGKIYLMNMPTGSGKTLCSMKFALEKAIKENKKIIYIIPYNSIIDQTADVFENLFGDDLKILRHQSNFEYENKEDESEEYDYKKASENWDSDFVITTAVQFFESIYGCKRRKLRKLHNMANAILIFDEAHLMPIDFLQPCLNGILQITKFLNSEAVFLTATMPDFKQLIIKYCDNSDLHIVDLVNNKDDFIYFSKCDYKYLGKTSIENIFLDDSPTKLIVVNSKKSAREIYNKCVGQHFHLSTYMTGKDRMKTIENIKNEVKKLNDEFENYYNIPEDRKITVVSTSLIEAGVDLDFSTVYRELSGLDSILQAGGRCNREGKYPKKDSNVYIFELDDKPINANASITKGILNEFSDINNLDCVKEYYSRLFKINESNITKNRLTSNKAKLFMIDFRTYAENFNIINDDDIVTVIVPTDDFSKDLMRSAQFSGLCNLRKLQSYMVSVKLWEFEDLKKQGVVDDYNTGAFFLINDDYYDVNLGILFNGKDYII